MINKVSSLAPKKEVGKTYLSKEQTINTMLNYVKNNNLKQFQNLFDPAGKMKNIALSKESPSDLNGPALKLMLELKEKFVEENPLGKGYYFRQREGIVELIQDSEYFPCFAADVKLNKTTNGYRVDYVEFWK